MNKAAVRNQINAIRTMLDVIEAEIGKEPKLPTCDHKNIKNLTTMGSPDEWRCNDCGLHYKEGDELQK